LPGGPAISRPFSAVATSAVDEGAAVAGKGKPRGALTGLPICAREHQHQDHPRSGFMLGGLFIPRNTIRTFWGSLEQLFPARPRAVLAIATIYHRQRNPTDHTQKQNHLAIRATHVFCSFLACCSSRKKLEGFPPPPGTKTIGSENGGRHPARILDGLQGEKRKNSEGLRAGWQAASCCAPRNHLLVLVVC